MNKKIKRDFDGLMYSTDDSMSFESESSEQETLPPQQQKLMIRLETKQRGGKKATLIKGFIGKSEDLESLSKKLKSHCGTGGSIVDGEMLIQGDMVQKVKAFLQANGYKTNNI
ncbi:MAG: translation initiation factor [Bacteroidota bacterium]|jgi:translation initiation factor 1|nr:translation initiation factor [Bacteroidota bacterium]